VLTREALQAYQSVKPRVMDIMAEIVGECVNEPQQRRTVLNKLGAQITGKAEEQRWRIFVTGHSMGGAKATLCAYELAVHTISSRAWRMPKRRLNVCMRCSCSRRRCHAVCLRKNGA
jgi:hypothetical protein